MGTTLTKHTGPWRLDELAATPVWEWAETHETYPLVRGLYYAGERYRGRETRVFAWMGTPRGSTTKSLPGIVLVHGGGGKAFPEWAQMWAARGYVAIAMDLAGKGPDGQSLPDGGPGQEFQQKFNDISQGIEAAWPYQAVANVLRGISLLAALPGVDPARIVMTGISWGGYLTCMAASLDDRIAAAAPVYGCGYLHEDSTWLEVFAKMPAGDRAPWIANFDPSQYLHQCTCPMLWVNGTNDFAYPLGSYQKSYRCASGRRTLCIEVNMPHGHGPGWRPREIAMFFNTHVSGGIPLTHIGPMQRDGRNVSVPFASDVAIITAALHYCLDEGPWVNRTWRTRPAILEGNTAGAALPGSDKPLVYYMTLIDARGALVSSEHEIAS